MRLNSICCLRKGIVVATESSGLHRTVLLAAFLAAFAAVPATAAAQPTDGSTGVDVEVTTAITLTGPTAEFTLRGMPGATITGPNAVVLNVETNNIAGYLVTVQSRTPAMVANAPGNADAVPIGALAVRESGTDSFAPLSVTAPVTVHSQPVASEEGGDDLSNDFRMVFPFVHEDVYTAALDYVATTL